MKLRDTIITACANLITCCGLFGITVDEPMRWTKEMLIGEQFDLVDESRVVFYKFYNEDSASVTCGDKNLISGGVVVSWRINENGTLLLYSDSCEINEILLLQEIDGHKFHIIVDGRDCVFIRHKFDQSPIIKNP